MGNWDKFARTGGRDVSTTLPMALGAEAADTVMAAGRAVSGSHAV
jgi:NADPH:quinone reductase-like Zn-dependent oxidoreductase